MKLWIVLALLGSTAFAQQYMAGGVGLNGYPENAPVISAVAESTDARTVVLSWTTNIASDSRGSCGSEPAADQATQTPGTSHQIGVGGLLPSTAYTCTVQSGSTTATIAATTTAAPATTPITSVTFGTLTDYNLTSPPCAMTGDTYFNFVSSDNMTYLITDDTGGWTGSCNTGASAMIAKFSNESPLVGANVNSLSGYGGEGSILQPGYYNLKMESMFGMSGNLFMFLERQNQQAGSILTQFYGNIIESTDHGVHVNNYASKSTTTTTGVDNVPGYLTLFTGNSPTNFATCAFVLYGADDGTNGYLVAGNRVDNANLYVYLLCAGLSAGGSGWNNDDNMYLLRVPRAKLAAQNPNDYQAYVSGDGTLDSNWTSNLASAGVVLSSAGELSLPAPYYIPALNRYIMLTFYYPGGATSPGSSVVQAWEAPHPWGTWTLVGTQTNPTLGYYGDVLLHRSVINAPFSGTTATYMTTGDFGNESIYHMYYGTLTISH